MFDIEKCLSNQIGQNQIYVDFFMTCVWCWVSDEEKLGLSICCECFENISTMTILDDVNCVEETVIWRTYVTFKYEKHETKGHADFYMAKSEDLNVKDTYF